MVNRSFARCCADVAFSGFSKAPIWTENLGTVIVGRGGAMTVVVSGLGAGGITTTSTVSFFGGGSGFFSAGGVSFGASFVTSGGLISLFVSSDDLHPPRDKEKRIQNIRREKNFDSIV